MAEAVVLGEMELTNVTRIKVDQGRKLVKSPIPGWDGDLIQDQGAAAIQLQISGLDFGPDAGNTLEAIRQAAADGSPLDFTASATIATDIEQVLVGRFIVHQQGGQQTTFHYSLDLVQYVPPPSPLALDGFDLDFADRLTELTDLSVVADMESFAENLGNPLAEAVAGIDEAMAAVDDVVEFAEDIVDKAKAAMDLKKLVSAVGTVLKNSAS